MRIKEMSALLFLSAWLCSGSVLSAANTESNAASALIRTTLNNSPAMTEVKLAIQQLAPQGFAEEKKVHSWALSLKPGNYMATAKMGNIVRNRTFSVQAGDKVDIVIAMDK